MNKKIAILQSGEILQDVVMFKERHSKDIVVTGSNANKAGALQTVKLNKVLRILNEQRYEQLWKSTFPVILQQLSKCSSKLLVQAWNCLNKIPIEVDVAVSPYLEGELNVIRVESVSANIRVLSTMLLNSVFGRILPVVNFTLADI